MKAMKIQINKDMEFWDYVVCRGRGEEHEYEA